MLMDVIGNSGGFGLLGGIGLLTILIIFVLPIAILIFIIWSITRFIRTQEKTNEKLGELIETLRDRSSNKYIE